MNKLDMQSKNIISDNISKLKELFPNAFVDDEVNFDILKQELDSYDGKQIVTYIRKNWLKAVKKFTAFSF